MGIVVVRRGVGRIGVENLVILLTQLQCRIFQTSPRRDFDQEVDLVGLGKACISMKRPHHSYRWVQIPALNPAQ
jgi:hypothetical protein